MQPVHEHLSRNFVARFVERSYNPSQRRQNSSSLLLRLNMPYFRSASRVVLAIVSSVSLVTSTPAKSAADGSTEEFERLQKLWDAQQSDINTARVKFRQIAIGGHHLTEQLARDRINELVLAADLAGDPNSLKTLLEDLCGPSKLIKPWATGVLYIEGDSRRYEHASVSGAVTVHVISPKKEVYFDGRTMQMDVYGPGGSKVFAPKLNDLRYVGSAPAEPFEMITDPEGMLVLQNSHLRMVVDKDTGALHRVARKNRMGDIVREVLQERWMSYADGVVFPTVVSTASYKSDGLLQTLKISVLEEAEFNVRMPEGLLELSSRPGTWVWDYRTDPNPHPQRPEVPPMSH